MAKIEAHELDPLRFIQENFGLHEFAFEDYTQELQKSGEIESILFILQSSGHVLLGYDKTNSLVQTQLPQTFCLFSHCISEHPKEILLKSSSKSYYSKSYAVAGEPYRFMVFLVASPKTPLSEMEAIADDLLDLFESLYDKAEGR